MRAISTLVPSECIIINQRSQYTINSSAFPVWSWRLQCTCPSVFLFIFSANSSATSDLIIMTWLVFEVLMVVVERGVGVEESGGRLGEEEDQEVEGVGVRLLLRDC